MAITASIIAASAVISAGTSIYSSVQAGNAQKKAANAANDQQQAQDKLLSEAQAKQTADKTNADSIAARDAARNKQRTAAAAATGRQDTILTGALGLTDNPQTQGKTILGG